MRPARKGPENLLGDQVGEARGIASMRPARKGPENGGRTRRNEGVVTGFNEAGPQGAGKHRTEGTERSPQRASMRPARKGPENACYSAEPECDVHASMRPARKGPENGRPLTGRPLMPASFNEAGPQGAGKRTPATGSSRRQHGASMRPARKGPENVVDAEALRARRGASMRPARKGPENAPGPIRPRGRRPASMRPARKGPENVPPLATRWLSRSRRLQ